jgi:hypothetical protein
MVTPEAIARHTITHMGRATNTYGAYKHKLSAAILTQMTQDERFAMFMANYARMSTYK